MDQLDPRRVPERDGHAAIVLIEGGGGVAVAVLDPVSGAVRSRAARSLLRKVAAKPLKVRVNPTTSESRIPRASSADRSAPDSSWSDCT